MIPKPSFLLTTLLVALSSCLTFDGSDFQYIVGLDKMTGETAWKTDRSVGCRYINEKTGAPERDGDWRKIYSTPRVIEVGGREELISLGAMALYSYDRA